MDLLGDINIYGWIKKYKSVLGMRNKSEKKIQAPWSFVEQYYTDDLAERDTLESKWAFEWLKWVKGPNVLSWGCGPNFYDDSLFFNEPPKEFVGIDLNKSNIDFLKKSIHPEVLRCKNVLMEHGTKVQLSVGDIRDKQTSFVNHFDTVYAIGVLGMFRESKLNRLLKLAYSYLRPGGRLIDIDWTDCRLSEEKYRERESFEWYSKQGPNIEKIGELLQENRFKILKDEIYNVQNSVEYGWGEIYAYVAEKSA